MMQWKATTLYKTAQAVLELLCSSNRESLTLLNLNLKDFTLTAVYHIQIDSRVFSIKIIAKNYAATINMNMAWYMTTNRQLTDTGLFKQDSASPNPFSFPPQLCVKHKMYQKQYHEINFNYL